MFDTSGTMFIADTANNRVRRVEAGTDAVVSAGPSETMTTVAGNGTATTPGNAPVDGIAATLSTLNQPTGLVFAGTSLLIADRNNHRIRKVISGTDGYVDGTGTETISTFAGTLPSGYYGDGGAAKAAGLSSPHAICRDAGGNIYIGDTANSRIRRVLG